MAGLCSVILLAIGEPGPEPGHGRKSLYGTSQRVLRASDTAILSCRSGSSANLYNGVKSLGSEIIAASPEIAAPFVIVDLSWDSSCIRALLEMDCKRGRGAELTGLAVINRGSDVTL